MGQPQSEQAGYEGKRITVFLLDDHEIVRRGVRELLEAEPDIVVIGEAGTATSALARVPALRPGVAVLGRPLPPRGGGSRCRENPAGTPRGACPLVTALGA